MRPIFLRAVAGASLSLSALMVSPADSVPIAIPTAMKSASDAQSLTQVVHCRKYRPGTRVSTAGVAVAASMRLAEGRVPALPVRA